MNKIRKKDVRLVDYSSILSKLLYIDIRMVFIKATSIFRNYIYRTLQLSNNRIDYVADGMIVTYFQKDIPRNIVWGSQSRNVERPEWLSGWFTQESRTPGPLVCAVYRRRG